MQPTLTNLIRFGTAKSEDSEIGRKVHLPTQATRRSLGCSNCVILPRSHRAAKQSKINLPKSKNKSKRGTKDHLVLSASALACFVKGRNQEIPNAKELRLLTLKESAKTAAGVINQM